MYNLPNTYFKELVLARKSFLARRSASSNAITISRHRMNLDCTQDVEQLWKRYRPIAEFLEILPKETSEHLMQESRSNVISILRDRFPNAGVHLEGSVIVPLGISLD